MFVDEISLFNVIDSHVSSYSMEFMTELLINMKTKSGLTQNVIFSVLRCEVDPECITGDHDKNRLEVSFMEGP